MQFTENEKIALFDKIDELYFHRNFGCTSKSDFETLLFSEYINSCISQGLPNDDYSLAKELGITQSRVRALKERKELKYPTHSDNKWWMEALAEAGRNAKYDDTDHYIKFIIQDVNVMNEVRHYIESVGWFDEVSLNRKLIRIPLDCFAEIFLNDQSLSGLFTTEVEDKLRNLYKEHSDNENLKNFVGDFSKDGMKSFLMSASKETICLVLQTLPFGGLAKTAFNAIEKVIANM